MFYNLMFCLVWIYAKIFYPTKLVGKENLQKGKCIYACNHQSAMDGFLAVLKVKNKPNILAKKELFKNKFMGFVFKKLKAIPVNRGEADIGAIKKVLSALKKGEQLLVFPQGTRKEDAEDMQALKSGTAMFALKGDAPIVPMMFLKKPRMFRRNTLVVGKPINLDEFKQEKPTKETYEKVSNLLTQKMEELYKSNALPKKMQMNISISGYPCSGKSTIIEYLKNKYDFSVISGGALYRAEAKKRNLTVLGLNELAKVDRSVDLALDKQLHQEGVKNKGKKVIFDSRLAWHFVPQSFKVFVIINEKELGKRLYNSDRPIEEKCESEEEALKAALYRRELERERYKQLYNLDLFDFNNYDFIALNENRTAEETAEEIYEKYLAYCRENYKKK